jgi:hypothetical protein
VTEWYWHIHHELLCEPLTGPLENRLTYIREHKPEAERETRLRLIHPVVGALPTALVKARALLIKARADYNEAQAAHYRARMTYDAARMTYDAARALLVGARTAYDDARAVYYKARMTYDEEMTASLPALEALHAVECPHCPWDGKSIFPGKEATE